MGAWPEDTARAHRAGGWAPKMNTDGCGGPEPGMEMASCCSRLVKSLQCPLLTKCEVPPAGQGEMFTGSSTWCDTAGQRRADLKLRDDKLGTGVPEFPSTTELFCSPVLGYRYRRDSMLRRIAVG